MDVRIETHPLSLTPATVFSQWLSISTPLHYIFKFTQPEKLDYPHAKTYICPCIQESHPPALRATWSLSKFSQVDTTSLSPPTFSTLNLLPCPLLATLRQASIVPGSLNIQQILTSSSMLRKFPFLYILSHLFIYLSAVNETPSGALQSFIINPDGTLSPPQDTIPSDGDFPAFTAALSTGHVAVMNYGTGNGRIVPTPSSPLRFDQAASVITFPVKPGTTVSHPHMAVEHGNEIFIPDLVSCPIYLSIHLFFFLLFSFFSPSIRKLIRNICRVKIPSGESPKANPIHLHS